MRGRLRPSLLIARHELQRLLRSRVFPWLLGGTTLLIFLSALLGTGHSQRLRDERQRYQALALEKWQQQPDRHPHRVAHFGSFAYRDLGPLAAFDHGVDSFAGTTIFQEAHRQNAAAFSLAGQSSLLLRFGEFSLAMVLQIVLPLIAVVWGFGTLARERETGLLLRTLAEGASAQAILFGKLLGLVGVLGLLSLPGLGLAACVLLVGQSPSPPLTGELPARCVLLAISYALYLITLCAAVVLVSALASGSRATLLTLLMVFGVSIVAMPRLAHTLASRLHPAPSRFETEAAVAAELRTRGDSHDPASPAHSALRQAVLKRHAVARLEDLPFNFGGYLMARAEAESSAVMAKHRRHILDIHERQNAFARLAAVVTPVTAVRALSSAFAGTTSADFLSFAQQAEAHRYEFVQRLNDLHTRAIHFENDRAQRVGQHHFREFTPFVVRARSLGPALAETGWAALATLGWLLALCAALRFTAGRLRWR